MYIYNTIINLVEFKKMKGDHIMWTTPVATEMRFGFEVTMYVMNKNCLFSYIKKRNSKSSFFYGSLKPLGNKTHIRPSCFILPAILPALFPCPQ